MTLVNSNNITDYITDTQGSLVEHFLGNNYVVNALATGVLGLSGTVSGGTITNVADNLILNTTSVRLATGATSTGRASLLSGLNINWNSSSGYLAYETRVIIPTLSDTAQTYVISLGFANSTTASNRHIRFITGNGTIRGACSNGNGTEVLTGTTNILANTWYTLKIVLYSSTYCDFLVNGGWIGSLNTSLPINTGLAVQANIVKTVGTTSRFFYIDYIALEWKF